MSFLEASAEPLLRTAWCTVTDSMLSVCRRGWYEGLSEAFLGFKGPKVLMLAGTDRLDRTLTIGQMQGRFQMVVLPQVSHVLCCWCFLLYPAWAMLDMRRPHLLCWYSWGARDLYLDSGLGLSWHIHRCHQSVWHHDCWGKGLAACRSGGRNNGKEWCLSMTTSDKCTYAGCRQGMRSRRTSRSAQQRSC